MVKRPLGPDEKRNRNGCYLLVLLLTTALLVFGFLGLQRAERKQMNEAVAIPAKAHTGRDD